MPGVYVPGAHIRRMGDVPRRVALRRRRGCHAVRHSVAGRDRTTNPGLGGRQERRDQPLPVATAHDCVSQGRTWPRDGRGARNRTNSPGQHAMDFHNNEVARSMADRERDRIAAARASDAQVWDADSGYRVATKKRDRHLQGGGRPSGVRRLRGRADGRQGAVLLHTHRGAPGVPRWLINTNRPVRDSGPAGLCRQPPAKRWLFDSAPFVHHSENVRAGGWAVGIDDGQAGSTDSRRPATRFRPRPA